MIPSDARLRNDRDCLLLEELLITDPVPTKKLPSIGWLPDVGCILSTSTEPCRDVTGGWLGLFLMSSIQRLKRYWYLIMLQRPLALRHRLWVSQRTHKKFARGNTGYNFNRTHIFRIRFEIVDSGSSCMRTDKDHRGPIGRRRPQAIAFYYFLSVVMWLTRQREPSRLPNNGRKCTPRIGHPVLDIIDISPSETLKSTQESRTAGALPTIKVRVYLGMLSRGG